SPAFVSKIRQFTPAGSGVRLRQPRTRSERARPCFSGRSGRTEFAPAGKWVANPHIQDRAPDECPGGRTEGNARQSRARRRIKCGTSIAQAPVRSNLDDAWSEGAIAPG